MTKEDKSGESGSQSLLSERIRDARISATAYLKQLPEVTPLPRSEGPLHLFVSGVGPGEAHARYLVHLINRHTGHTATYVAISEAQRLEEKQKVAGSYFIVFSQDLNPHSQALIKSWTRRDRMILFTAATVSGFFAASKDARGLLLQELESEGAMTVIHPMERETTLFLQVIGPMCGYIAAVHWLNQALGAEIKMIEGKELANALMKVTEARKSAAWDQYLEEASRIEDIWATGAVSVYGHNLPLKLCKGLFRRLPHLSDVHAFADGPFQSAFRAPRHQWLLATPDRMSSELATRFRGMCSNAGIPHRLWLSPLPEPWAILYFEQLFNFLVLAVSSRRKLDQENWPGRGMDGSIYELSETGATQEQWLGM